MAGVHHGFSAPVSFAPGRPAGLQWARPGSALTAVPSPTQEIRYLAEQFRLNERNLALYFPNFDATPAPGSLNRVFGAPVGMHGDLWPRFDGLQSLLSEANMLDQWREGDLRMEHVFTVDLKGLRLHGAPHGARAMMLFVSNAAFHHADQNGNDHTHVVFLTEEEVTAGLHTDPIPTRSLGQWSRRFSLERIDVPGDVFDPNEDGGSPTAQLHEAIWQAPARLGGCPIWVRDPNTSRDFSSRGRNEPTPRAGLRGANTFLMQFERRFADLNLGRDGVMYVSGTGAYYQDYT